MELWRIQMLIVASIMLISIGMGLNFSMRTTKSVTKPIEKIIDNIQQVKEGKYDINEVKNAGKEIDILLNAFEDMAKTIECNVKTIEEKAQLEKQLLKNENENLRISQLLIDSEIKALQSQINPHLLFNTISMLSKIAYIEGANKTSKLMEATADLLRYGMDKSSKLSDLFSELNCVENYFYIQRERFGDRGNFILKYDEDLPNIPMPGMVLQPLLENSVIHGIKDSTEDGLVEVRANYINEDIVIIVEDNGVGFDSDTLEMIQVKEDSNSIYDFIQRGKKTEGIGLLNVRKRLQMCYGERMDFLIESSDGCGTVITIIISQEGIEYV